MMAMLSSPGLYKDLKVEAHGYSLAPAAGGKRQFLLKASVAAADLGLAPVSREAVRGAVSFRGAVLSKKGLQCEFSDTIDFELARRGGDEPSGRIGLETVCPLKEGDHEVLVAARDETGGALGTYWGRVRVKPAERQTGPTMLLWGPAGADVRRRESSPAWLPSDKEPFFVRDSFTLAAGEPAALTILACGDRKRVSGEDSFPVSLDGPAPIELTARPVSSGGKDRCHLWAAAIPANALWPGVYTILPRSPASLHVAGPPVRISVRWRHRREGE